MFTINKFSPRKTKGHEISPGVWVDRMTLGQGTGTAAKAPPNTPPCAKPAHIGMVHVSPHEDTAFASENESHVQVIRSHIPHWPMKLDLPARAVSSTGYL